MSERQPNLLIVISGDLSTVRRAFERACDSQLVEVVELQEKEAVELSRIVPLLRTKRYEAVAFGVRRLSLQRFQLFLKMDLLCSRPARRMIIDEAGEYLRAKWTVFLLVDLPKFVVELVASAFTLLRAYAMLLLLRKQGERR